MVVCAICLATTYIAAKIAGFDAPKSSVRASLANLDDADYTAIGKRLRELVDEYYQRWQKAEQK